MYRNLLLLLLVLVGCSDAPAETKPETRSEPEFGGVVVTEGTSTRYLANQSDPGIGMKWIGRAFDDSSWQQGPFGVGGEWGQKAGAKALVASEVPRGTWSIYTRTPFEIPAVSGVENLFFGVEYDDAIVVWINGVEVFRSDSMPAGSPRWNGGAESHESSNGAGPNYGPLLDITEVARPALRDGANILAIGVWNASRDSGDLVLSPKLLINAPFGVLITREPYLQLGTPTAVTVRWRTDKPTDSQVWYGEQLGALDLTQTVSEPTTEHSVTLSGLHPSTRYYYAVGGAKAKMAGGEAMHSFVTSPAPGSDARTRFWVMGDSGTGTYHAVRARNGFERFSGDDPPEFLVLMGDNAYKQGRDFEYQSAFFVPYRRQLAGMVSWSTMGNHESVDNFLNIFDIPVDGSAGGVASESPYYYSFDHGRVHFICLNSERVDRSPKSPMIEWLKRDLKASKADWTIVFWHHTPYPTGDRTGSTDPSIVEMRTNVLPVLDDADVDLVLTGHTHSYERSFLMQGHYGDAEELDPAMILDAGDGRMEGQGPYRKSSAPHSGIVYVVMGSSGEALRIKHTNPALYVGLNTVGSMIVEIEGNRLTSRFIDSHGRVPDRFTIEKELLDD